VTARPRTATTRRTGSRPGALTVHSHQEYLRTQPDASTDPLQFGIYDNDVWITTNYSAAAPVNASAGAWHTIPISADVQISSPVGYRRRQRSASIRVDRTPWNATVYGKDGCTTVHTAAGSDGLNFHVVNILEVRAVARRRVRGRADSW
jgi:hypothetical protein